MHLDPAHPPLWRSPDVLQFGEDARVVLAAPQPWQERVIAALESGATDSDVVRIAAGFGVDATAAGAFLAELRPVLEREPAAPRLPLAVLDQMRLTGAARDMLVQALADGGWTTVDPQRPAGVALDGLPVVVIAAHVVDPRLVSHLMAADLVHVPVVVGERHVEVGPVVTPGRTACLACVWTRRRDADPAWPAVAAQLMGRSAPPLPPSRAAEAGAVAARLLRDALVVSGRARTRSLTLHAGSLHRRTRWHRPHAACGCRSLEGIATADDLADPEPTSATATGPPG